MSRNSPGHQSAQRQTAWSVRASRLAPDLAPVPKHALGPSIEPCDRACPDVHAAQTIQVCRNTQQAFDKRGPLHVSRWCFEPAPQGQWGKGSKTTPSPSSAFRHPGLPGMSEALHPLAIFMDLALPTMNSYAATISPQVAL
jgi:hypothetical protein